MRAYAGRIAEDSEVARLGRQGASVFGRGELDRVNVVTGVVTLTNRRKRLRQRILFGMLGLGLAGLAAVSWAPWRYDLIPRTLPPPERVDPNTAKLFAPGAKVLLITAHPDDAEFYLGGTLSKLADAGAEIRLVLITDGDKAYYPFQDVARNRRVRQAEQREAAAVWRAREVTFLGFADGRFSVDEPVLRAAQREIERFQPDYLFGFDADFPPRLSHRDHRNAGVVARIAAARSGKRLWLIRFSTIAPNYFVDTTALWQRKMALVAIHRSQFSGEKLVRIEQLIRKTDEKAGRKGGYSLAEGLRCERL